jgi:hypothetical protein
MMARKSRVMRPVMLYNMLMATAELLPVIGFWESFPVLVVLAPLMVAMMVASDAVCRSGAASRGLTVLYRGGNPKSSVILHAVCTELYRMMALSLCVVRFCRTCDWLTNEALLVLLSHER